MKKSLIMALAVLSAVAVTACGEVVETETTDTSVEVETEVATEDQQAEVVLDATPVTTGDAENAEAGIALDDVTITASGVKLVLGQDFTANIDAVGEATIVEGQACLEGGYDTNYYYNDEALVVYTVASDGQQVIYDVYVTSESYTTAKGATVGTSTKDDITAMYGEPSSTAGAAYIYDIAGRNAKATFAFTADGVLESIDVLDEQ